tara:strand:- start:549 stop:809 length:261 start_codon:yes stop_codon:yes gene_type:complete
MELKDQLNLLWKYLFLAVFTYGVITLTCCKNETSGCCKNNQSIAPCQVQNSASIKTKCGSGCSKTCCKKTDKAPCGANCSKPCCSK